MGAKKKKTYANYFYDVVRENENALTHLSNIRLKFYQYTSEPWKAKVGPITKEYDICINSIKNMLESYRNLKTCLDIDLSSMENNFHKKIAKAEKAGIEHVLCLEAIVDEIRPKEEAITTLEKLYNTVEKLNIKYKDSRRSGKILTLHDCIRYLHQESIDALFDAIDSSDIKINEKKFMGEGGIISNFKAIDVREQIAPSDSLKKHLSSKPVNSKNVKNIPLRAILEAYQNLAKTVKVDYGQKIKMLVYEDSVLAQIKLGCHYAKLESQMNDTQAHISFTYQDTDDDFSANRLIYIKLILRKLGYNIEVKNKNIKADLYNKTKNHTYGALRETIRLLTSTLNLDIRREIKGREYEAVYRFLHGETDLEYALQDSKKIKTKKCKKFIAKYEYCWDGNDI